MRPTEILSSEHRVIEQMLDCVDALAERGEAEGRLDATAASKAVQFLRLFADTCHHGKEEKHLFARIGERGLSPHAGPVAVMLHEHELGRSLIRGMDSAVHAQEAAAFARNAREYSALLRAHIQKEDMILFPMADRVLTSDDQTALLAAFDQEEEGLPKGTHEQMLALLEGLAAELGVQGRAAGPVMACCGHGPSA